MRNLLLLATLVVAPACGTSVAQVPHVDRAAAQKLVLEDLDLLAEQPSAVHWRRTYRHFDRHLEPHLSASARLELEVAFGELRRELKMAPPEEWKQQVLAVKHKLQPQD